MLLLLLHHQLVAVRVVPWGKANLNYTAQALIISAGIYFVVINQFSSSVSNNEKPKEFKDTVVAE